MDGESWWHNGYIKVDRTEMCAIMSAAQDKEAADPLGQYNTGSRGEMPCHGALEDTIR